MKNNLLKRMCGFILGAVMCFAVCGGAVACTKPVANDENTLEIFIADFGYGTEWLDKSVEAFKNEEWVKTKYPLLSIPKISKKSVQEEARSLMTGGPKGNTVDLLFTCSETAAVYFDSSDNYFEDLSEDVYNQPVPGETQLLKDKMNPKKYDEAIYIKDNGDSVIYSMPWVSGYMGMFINETVAQQLLGDKYTGYDMIRTTDELKQFCEDIKNSPANTDKSIAPFISSTKSNYWRTMFNIWWAQYEGEASYDNFWRGLNARGEVSNEIFSQKGREEAIKTIYSLMAYPSGNSAALSEYGEFATCQANFLDGKAVMMPNGDWIENETAEYLGDKVISALKNPVISSIINKCDSVTTDARLSATVKCVDEGKSYAEAKESLKDSFELSSADYKRIEYARNVVVNIGGHEAYVPSYATAKEIAKDFLRFLATDKAIEIFMDTLKGCRTAFDYDIESKNPELYNRFSKVQKDLAEIAETQNVLADKRNYKLVSKGGMKALLGTSFESQMLVSTSNGAHKTPDKIFREEKEAGEREFPKYCTAAGITG